MSRKVLRREQQEEGGLEDRGERRVRPSVRETRGGRRESKANRKEKEEACRMFDA